MSDTQIARIADTHESRHDRAIARQRAAARRVKAKRAA